MYSLACMRIRHITQVSSYLPTPPQTLSPNLNHLVIPKSVDPSRIEGRFSHHDARVEASRHTSSSNSKLQAHRALRRRDQAARQPRRQTRATVSHMHARVVSPLAPSPPSSHCILTISPLSVLGLVGAPSASPIAQTRSPGSNLPIALVFFIPVYLTISCTIMNTE